MKAQGKPIDWRKQLAMPLTWHIAGAVALLILTLFFGIRLGLDWSATHGRRSDALADKQAQVKALELETVSLRGLDARVGEAHEKLNNFYARRVPPSYSAISARVGELQVRSGVRLMRVQYSQGKPGDDLTEIALDTTISGDYRSILHFVNSIERDQMFFVIRAMALTGQQGGSVNLRILISTWLRPDDAAASGLPLTSEVNAANAANAAADASKKEER
jgi:Tfp pilus assembly protein PilO